MKKIISVLLPISLISVLSFSIAGCNQSKELDLRDETIRKFVSAKKEKTICEILTSSIGQHDQQAGFITVGKDPENDFNMYEIELSEYEDYKDSFKMVSFFNPVPTFGAIPGRTYYYRINEYNDPSNYVKTGKITTKKEPGTFYTVDGMNNVRDLGGWKAEGGKRLNFDKIIRGGKPNYYDNTPAYSDKGRAVLMDSLKIYGEIDLRNENDNFGQTLNIFDETYPYLTVAFMVDSEILPDFQQNNPVPRKYNKNAPIFIKKIFSFLADESNYPVYIHCNAGADRTGTVCMLIEGVLGLSVDDIYKDFELTSFSPYAKRWRSSIDYETLSFDKSGVMQDDYNNYVAMGKCVDSLWRTYAPNGSYQEAVTNYLKTVCDVTDDEISSLKNIMLEK